MKSNHCSSRLVFVFAFLVFLSGCSSAPAYPWLDKTGEKLQHSCAQECTEADAIKAFVIASSFCRSVHNYYEAGGNYAGYTKATIGVVGTLAGAVAAPLSSGSATKAWAGLAGATNAMQSSMEDAMSTTLSLKRQSAIATSMAKDTLAIETNNGPALSKVVASIKMTNNCWLAIGEADASVIRAIAGSGKPNEDQKSD